MTDCSDYTCFGCRITDFMADTYSAENPLDIEEAIPVLVELLVGMISSLELREDRRAATSDVVRWLKDGVKQAHARPAPMPAPSSAGLH